MNASVQQVVFDAYQKGAATASNRKLIRTIHKFRR